MLEEEPRLRDEEDEGEPASPPLDLEGNERTVSRLRAVPADPDPPDRDPAPFSRDGADNTRPEEAPDEAPAFPSRDGKLRTRDTPEFPPAEGK